MSSLGDLYVTVGAKIDGFSAAFGTVNDTLKQTAREAKSASSGWKEAFGSMQTVGLGLSAAVTAPILGIGGAALTMFGDFESSMNRVSALGEITGQSLNKLKELAIDLGAKTKFSAKQAADGMAELSSAGFNTTQIMQAMPGVLALAAAGQLDVGQAAEIAANLMGGFGISADGIGRATDVIAKAAASGSLNVQDLAYTFKYVGPIAKAAGIGFEEVAAATTLLSNAGLKGEQAGTGLRGMMASLIDPSKEAAKAMASLGLVATDSTGKLLPLENIVGQLGAKGATTKDIFTIFGRETAAAVSALVNAGAPALRTMTTELTNSEGAAAKMAGTMNQGLSGAFEKMKGSVETASISLGDSLAPVAMRVAGVVEALANKSSDLFAAFAKLPDSTQNIVLGFAGAAAATGPLLLALGTMGQSIIAVTSAAKLMGITMSGLMTAIPWVALAASLGLLVKGLYDYKTAVDNLKGSEKEQTDSLAKLEVSLRQQGANISELTKQYNQGQISQLAYIKGLQGFAIELGNAKKASGAAAGGAEKLTDAQLAQRKALEDAAKSAALLRKQQENLEKSSQDAKKSANALEKALEQMAVAGGKTTSKIESMKDSVNLIKLAWQAGKVPLSAYVESLATLQAEMNRSKIAELKQKVTDLTASYKAGLISTREFTEQNNVLTASITRLSPPVVAAKQSAEAFAEELAKLNAAVYASTAVLAPNATSLALYKATIDSIKTGAPVAEVGNLSTAIAGLSKDANTNLTTAKGHFDTFATNVSAAFTTFSASLGKLWTGEGSFGESFKKLWGDLKSAAIDTFITPVTDALSKFMSGVIADLLGGKGFGGVLDGLKSIGSGIAGIFGKSGGAVGDIAGGAAGQMGSIYDAATGAATSAGGGAASAAGSATSSSVSSIVGMVTGAVSAVSGIIGNFQFMGMNKSLDIIVQHTLQTANDLFNLRRDEWDRETHLFGKLDDWRQYLQLQMDTLIQVTRSGGDWLFEMKAGFQALQLPLEAMAGGGGVTVVLNNPTFLKATI